MTARPILFSAPMIQALLAGRKTQTRRAIKSQPDWERPEPCSSTTSEGWQGPLDFSTWAESADPEMELRRCPYGKPGDLLIVRETWKPHSTFSAMKPSEMPMRTVFYRADERYAPSNTPWKPSIFMPRWASRLTLEVTEVRAQRLQAISRQDAEAEGVEMETADPPFWYVPGVWPHAITAVGIEEVGEHHQAVRSYAKLWNHINGDDAWAANPWVWAVSFKVHRCNVDAVATCSP